MIYNIKIGLPIYKIIYSLLFIVILSWIRGISSIEEIGGVLDPFLALLALIVCSDAYYQEIQGGRYEVFYLLPKKKQFVTIVQRLLVQWIFLLLLTLVGYFSFQIIQRPSYFYENENLIEYIGGMFLACMGSQLFFGVLSFTLVNIVRNLWVGIGISFILWDIFNSTLGQKLPNCLRVFAYGNTEDILIKHSNNWIFGKVTAITIAMFLLIFNKFIITRQRKG